jgi:hypothetical protein
VLDGTDDRILDRLRAVRRRRFLPTIENCTLLIDDASSYLRAADVDADAQQRWR